MIIYNYKKLVHTFAKRELYWDTPIKAQRIKSGFAQNITNA